MLRSYAVLNILLLLVLTIFVGCQASGGGGGGNGGVISSSPVYTTTISATTNHIADNVDTSTVTITVMNGAAPVAGIIPTYSVSGSNNFILPCSTTNASGVSTCILRSTKAEVKTLRVSNPNTSSPATVTFISGAISATGSTITSAGPATADGVGTMTINIALKDAYGNPVGGAVPTFDASPSPTNIYGACTAATANGLSSCTMRSSVAGIKTLRLTSPVTASGGPAFFFPGPPVAANSTIAGTTPHDADGVDASAILIQLRDITMNPVMGVVPTFSATGTGNIISACSQTDFTGTATCSLKSTVAEAKTIAIATPIVKTGNVVSFSTAIGAPVAANSSITGTSPVVADGVASSAITITLRDAGNNGVPGIVPTFSATDTGTSNIYGTCSSTDASGVSTCTLASTVAEIKTLMITGPVTKPDGTVVFIPGPPSSITSTIIGSSPVVADGVSTSTIGISIRDAYNNPIAGETPTFAATDSGMQNVYGACSVTSATGISTCTLASTVAEIKMLQLLTPVIVIGGNVTFTAGTPDASHSTITGTGPVIADGTDSSMISITLRDAFSNPVSGMTPTFSATDSGTSNTYSACTVTNASGVSTCSLRSTTAETKTLSIDSPVVKADGTVQFLPAGASVANSTITGSSPVTADGIATSTVTITLKDANNNPVVGEVPTFGATDTGTTNIYGVCSATDAAGVSTCTLASLKAELKTLSITAPITKADGTVTFNPGVPVAASSNITGTSAVADGTATSTITITLRDANNNPVSGEVPTFSATDTGSSNSYGACSATDASGVSTCSMTSLVAETKTLSIATPVSKSDGTAVFTAGPPVAANSTITGTTPVVADGTDSSTVSITLRDINNNAVSGVTPTFTATDTGSTNTYGTCSASDASGVSTCTLSSLVAETKTLSIVTPVVKSDGTVVFIPGGASTANSSISGTSPVTADGSATSTITITLKDANNNPVVGEVPTFIATDTGTTNAYGVCSATDASGISTCSLSSLKAEVKTLSIVSPVIKVDGTVTFTAGAPVAATSSITGSSPVLADGSATSTVTITVNDANNNPVSGITPTFTATDTGSTNSYGGCTASDSSGVSTCTLSSLKAEIKSLSIATPFVKAGGTVTFTAGAPVAANSSISGTSPVEANGVATSTVTITLLDLNLNPVSGVTPTFSATDTSSTNTYGTCSASDASGTSTCTLASLYAEIKNLSIATPVVKAGGTVTFTAGAAVAANSTITGTGPVVADGSATSTVTITLRDASNNPVSGQTPTFSATDTGTTNVYSACSASDASGVSTCTFTSTRAETKTLSIISPVAKSDGTVVFTAGSAVAANSTITGTGPVVADGSATSTVTITLLDAFNNPVSGQTPTFSATDTGTSNTYGTCSATNASGVSTCTLSSLKAETKTLSIVSPVSKADGTVVFTAGVPVAANSTITGTGPVVANGSATSTVTINLRDANNNPVSGQTPTFSATNTGSTNTYGTCSATNATGDSTCTLSSLTAESKTLSIVTPVAKSGGTVVFTAGSAVAANSTITGTGPVIANGSATSTVTITLRDASNNPVSGVTPTFSATDTGSGNTYQACSLTNASGVSTCTMRSTKAETKILSIVSPVSKADGTVVFTAGPAVAANSFMSATGPVVADGTATSTVTITLRDANNNPVSGATPTFSSSGLNNTLSACSVGDATGASTCTLRSTRAQVKTLGILTPVAKTNATTVTFIAGAPSAATTTITGTTPVSADGVSTSIISITILDAFSNPIAGTTPIFNATNTSNGNTYGACSASDASGLSLCTLASTRAEFKTLQLTSPVAVTGDVVEFSSSLPVAANSTISGTSPHLADGSADSTITITLRDANNNPVPGIEPTFSATNTGNGNTYDACSLSDAGGVSVCTMQSTVAEVKTLQITAPVTKAGGTVTFTAGPVAGATSTISGTSPVVADGTATSTITITLKDAFNNAVAGQTPTFTATGTLNTYNSCSASNAAGISTCTMSSTKAEVKTLSIATPVVKAGGTVTFTAGTPVAATSTITGTGPTNPDGISESTITITLRDVNSNTVSGMTPTFSASGTNNTYNACSVTNAAGVSTCTMTSTTAETKTLSIETPVSKADGTVVFATGSPSVANSTISATGPVVANGVATSTITITLRDNTNAPVVAIVPTFSSTGNSNTYNTCSATNTSGVSTCTMTSTKAEDKTVSIATPIVKAGNTITFTPGPASASTSTIECDQIAYKADGIETCNITVTILDAFSNPIAGTTPTINVTGTSNTVTACSATDALGQSSCTLKSTKPEGKFLSIVTPVAVSNPTEFEFNPNGIDIQVPIEMVDRGLSSSTGAITFARSRTLLNTNDYVGELAEYYFEIIASNTNTTTAGTVQLVDNANAVLTDSTITVAANTTAFTRFRVPFTPNDGQADYRIRLSGTSTAGQLRVHVARIIVQQTKAIKTKLYIPLIGGQVDQESNSDTGAPAASTTSTTFTVSSATYYYQYLRNDANYSAIPATNGWTLDVVMRINSTTATASAALFDKTNNQQITEATVTSTGSTAVVQRTVSFNSNATNFNDGDNLELRIRSSSTSFTNQVSKAGLWVTLKYLQKAETFWRLVNRRSSTTSTTLPDGRFLWEPTLWTNPTVQFMTFGSTNTTNIALWDMGLSDNNTTGTAVSTLTQPTAYGRTTSGNLTLTDGNRYIIRHNRTSGTANMGGAFLVIRAQE